ncbi:hypothetical protein ACVMAJ_007256 [Bradyrhizobium sp. USDA 4448]
MRASKADPAKISQQKSHVADYKAGPSLSDSRERHRLPRPTHRNLKLLFGEAGEQESLPVTY